MVNTNYVAQLFKTVSIQIISERGCYKARSIITLHFGMTSAQSFGMLKLAQSTACLYGALPVSVPFGSAQTPPPAAPPAKGSRVKGETLNKGAAHPPMNSYVQISHVETKSCSVQGLIQHLARCQNSDTFQVLRIKNWLQFAI